MWNRIEREKRVDCRRTPGGAVHVVASVLCHAGPSTSGTPVPGTRAGPNL